MRGATSSFVFSNRSLVRSYTIDAWAVPHAERAALRQLPSEWGTIYERFGVPAEIGLAQAHP
jgi:hypothetical protein